MVKRKADDRQHLSVSALKERGWTDTMVKRLLGEPDKTAKNPHYSSAPRTRLYALDRIQQVEADPEWRDKIAARREVRRAKDAARCEEWDRYQKQCRAELERFLETVTVVVFDRDLNREQLLRFGHQHAHELATSRGYVPRMTEEQAAVNYLRHQCSDYEETLAHDYRTTYAPRAPKRTRKELETMPPDRGPSLYREISRKVFLAIAEAYPWLADECDRQFRRKFGSALKNPAPAVD
jgi:hypothetical protein